MINTNPLVPIPIMVAICIVLLVLKRKGIISFIRQIIIVALVFMINLRISIPTGEVIVYGSEIDILFVVDNSISMLAEDYEGKDGTIRRIDAVKDDVEKIVNDFDGARYALITVTDTAQYQIPYTYQGDTVVRAVDALQGPTIMNASGTNFNESIKVILDVVENKDKYYESSEEERVQIIFFFSDGEQLSDEKLKSFDKLCEYIDGGYVFGYGTKDGGDIYVKYDYYSSPELFTYYDNNWNEQVVRPAIDEKSLEKIAEDMGLEYAHMTKPKQIKDITAEIIEKVGSGEISREDHKGDGYTEIYWMFALALAGFLFIDFVYYKWRLGQDR